MRRLRAVPPALPDVPRHRARAAVAARTHRGHAGGRVRRRAARRRVPPHDGDLRAVPRVRSRLPVDGAVRSPHRGRQPGAASGDRIAAPRPGRRRDASPSGSAFTVVLPRHRLLLAVTWVLLVAQRLHLVPRAVRAPAPLGAVAAHAAGGRLRAPVDAFLFPGCVMDAWQRDVHRAALDGHARDRRRGRPARSRRRLLRRAAHPRRPHRPGPTAGPAGHRVDARRRAGGRRQRRVRRGDEGLRAAARHAGGARVRGARARLLRVGRRAAAARRSATPARRSWCRTRATSATSSRRRARCAPCSRRRTGCGRPPTTACAAARAARTRCASRELAGEIRDRKVGALRAAQRDADGPLVVVSANPGCAMHLGAAGLTVRHPAELLARALVEPERPDA